MSLLRLPAAALLAWCATAQGAGFYFGDNGATALSQGFAFTAQADDLSAIQHNPAGLAQLDGFHFLADLQVLNNSVTFLRQDPGFDPANPNTLINTVQNTGGLFLLPFIGASYGLPLAGRPFTVALGAYAPPTVGRAAYAEPNYAQTNGTSYDQNPRKFAPQRYGIINNDLVIAYPTLSAAYAVHPRLQVGLSAQLVVSNFAIRQALFAGDSLGKNPMSQLDENPDYDAVVTANVAGRLGVTGILGVLAHPTDWLSIGASFRPPIPITASGTLDVKLSPVLDKLATVDGNKATLTFMMPLEAKLGVRLTPVKGLGINLDFVYQGWNSIDALVMTPNGVTLLQKTAGATPTDIAPVRLVKNWVPSFSGRLGGSYDVFKYLTVHAGVMYETGASPAQYYAVDFPHPSRTFVTGGLTGHLGPLDLVAAFAFTPTVSSTITESQVLRQQTDPTVTAGAIATGLYTSGGWVATVGLRGHFFGHEPAAQ
jgi:long-chain fatty acid transport protein